MSSFLKHCVLVVFLFGCLTGCVAHQGTATTTTPEQKPDCKAVQKDLLPQYQKALDEAKYPEAAKISKNLVALTRDTPELEFNDAGQVLMVTFTKQIYYEGYEKGKAFNLYGETWFTASPFLKDWCNNYQGENLLLRVQQMLGLPPKTECPNDSMVSLWVDPTLIFRPCPDPEVIDHECVVSLSGGHAAADQPPWYWGAAPQTSGAYVQVSETHMRWLYQNWLTRYSPKDPFQQYPWTALGYTYDWGGKSPVGMSEFVALGGTPVVFESLVPLDEYCGRP